MDNKLNPDFGWFDRGILGPLPSPGDRGIIPKINRDREAVDEIYAQIRHLSEVRDELQQQLQDMKAQVDKMSNGEDRQQMIEDYNALSQHLEALKGEILDLKMAAPDERAGDDQNDDTHDIAELPGGSGGDESDDGGGDDGGGEGGWDNGLDVEHKVFQFSHKNVDQVEPFAPESDPYIADMMQMAASPTTDPARSALLKPVDKWTEGEMKDVLNSAQGDFNGWTSGDPLKDHMYERVQDWHSHVYGDGEQQYDGGKPIEPQPITAIPDQPSPHITPDGQDLWQASADMGKTLATAAQTDGYGNAVKGLQNGLNMLNDANPPPERSPAWGYYTPQDKLAEDGDYGPNTDFALKSALSQHGADKVDNVLSLGRFNTFARDAAASGNSDGLDDKTTSLFGDDAGRSLQRSLNKTGGDVVDGWEPLKEDNWIGPKTTDAFNSVMDTVGPDEFSRGFGEEMGLL
ncbi:hypothetical protein [Magnetospirillum sp. 15-1]|uniref:hypothetical protein n=1 Tax=Magnetospirillum sp. 15-1 TaxID=1979370 RepID=UPI0014824163|nr:hypothetical protein [Magnetospirillum sp. 15-1]